MRETKVVFRQKLENRSSTEPIVLQESLLSVEIYGENIWQGSGNSVVDGLHQPINNVENVLANKEIALGILVNVKAALDNI